MRLNPIGPINGFQPLVEGQSSDRLCGNIFATHSQQAKASACKHSQGVCELLTPLKFSVQVTGK